MRTSPAYDRDRERRGLVGRLAPSHGRWALETAAVVIFVARIVATFERSRAAADPSLAFIMAALACFVASSLVSVWHTWNTMTARTAEELVWYVTTYQAVLRDLQIHGLALLMILGMTLRMLPAIFDLPRIADRRAWWALGLIGTALFGEVALFLAFRWTGHPAFAACLLLAWGLLAAGVLLIVVPWRPWDRSRRAIGAPSSSTRLWAG